MASTSKVVHVTTREDWRAWLEKNHAVEREVWLVFYKKHTKLPRVSYEDAVQEALCFGWIDSIVRRLDEDRYAQKFTPRKMGSQWAESNRRRVKKLVKEGRMTPAGMATIAAGVLREPQAPRPADVRETSIPPVFKKALRRNSKARKNFDNLAPSYRGNYVRWISAARREETRKKRVHEAIELLERNEKLGMK